MFSLRLLSRHLIFFSFAIGSTSVLAASPWTACNTLLLRIAKPAGLAVDYFRTPLLESGPHELTDNDLKDHFVKFGVYPTQSLDPNLKYKVNAQGQIQIANWYSVTGTLFQQQQRWRLNMDDFLKSENATSFNGAKKAFFSRLTYNPKTMRFEMPFKTLKEWGQLNHPPLIELEQRPLTDYSPEHVPINENQVASSVFSTPEFHVGLDDVSKSELTSGNIYKLLADSESTTERIKLIKNSKKSIWVSSLVFVKDRVTETVVDEMIQQFKNGIDVRIMTEKSLNFAHSKLTKKMLDAGIPVVFANDLYRYGKASIYHNKQFIVDEETAIMGGINMLDADLGSNGVDMKNRDLDVLVTGPVVTDMVDHFMADWNHFTTRRGPFSRNHRRSSFTDEKVQQILSRKQDERDAGLRGKAHYANWFSDPLRRSTGLGRFVAQKPYADMGTITRAVLAYLGSVKSYFGLTNPLAVDTRGKNRPNFNSIHKKIEDMLVQNPNIHMDYITSGVDFGLNEAVPMTVDRIRTAAARGNNLWANLNQSFLDFWNPRLACGSYRNLRNDYVPLQNADVWIHISFIHSKIWSFDRIASGIGSFNMNANATDISYEIMLFTQDDALNKELDRALVLDMANSIPFRPSRCSAQ